MLAFSMRKFFWGLIVVAAGCLIWADNLGYISLSFKFSRDWPVIIITLGLMSIWKALFGRHWWANKLPKQANSKGNASEILEELEKGKISAAEAAKRMGEK